MVLILLRLTPLEANKVLWFRSEGVVEMFDCFRPRLMLRVSFLDSWEVKDAHVFIIISRDMSLENEVYSIGLCEGCIVLN